MMSHSVKRRHGRIFAKGATESVARGSPTEIELEGEYGRPSESLIGEAQLSEPQDTSSSADSVRAVFGLCADNVRIHNVRIMWCHCADNVQVMYG